MGLAAGYGNLQVIDFDDRGSLAQFEKLCTESGLGNLLDLIKDGYFEHSPNGAHLLYRCIDVQSRKVLAGRPWVDGGVPKVKPLIETVNYIVSAPSYGGVNSSGDYKMVSGGLDTIVEISPEDRDSLYDIARILDERPPKKEPTAKPWKEKYSDTSIWDEYNAATDWAAILEPHGWEAVSSRASAVMWRRPGKEVGISATTNHKGNDLLHVFSSSTCFEADKSVTKSAAYTILNHGGDYTESGSQLRLLGYGQRIEIPERGVDISGIMKQARGNRSAPPQANIKDLLRVPGLVGELAEWINASSIRKQPVLALGAAIAAVSTILGRKVQTTTGLRSNIYILGVGETGCGKERARQAIKKLFAAINEENRIGESFASDSAVETAVINDPACLYMIDEIGHFLGTVKNDQTPSYVKAILPILLRMYSASEGTYRRRTFADPKRNAEDQSPIIDQPCLSIYGTTVPGNLYDNLSKKHASDGFLSRLLVFESQDPDPAALLPDKSARAVPPGLVAGFKRWADAKCNPNEVGNLGEEYPDPLEVETTKEAWSVFDGLELRMREKRGAVRAQGGDQGPYTRVWATAQKLALIRACGVKLDAPEVTADDARWGCALASLLTEQFLARVGDTVSENKTEEVCNRFLEIVRKAGGDGVSKNAITRQSRWARPQEQRDALATLEEGGQIRSEQEQTKGRARTKYYAE